LTVRNESGGAELGQGVIELVGYQADVDEFTCRSLASRAETVCPVPAVPFVRSWRSGSANMPSWSLVRAPR
jgi:hypothetical protein